MKIIDLKEMFNITQNPDHEDWLDISFKEDFIIPDINTDFKIKEVLKIELDNEYEEIFIEGAYRNNIEYDIHFGTIIVDDKERTLNMYYSSNDVVNNGSFISAGEVHTHIYMAYKLKNDKEIKRYGDYVIIANKNEINTIQEKIEFPTNKRYLKVELNG